MVSLKDGDILDTLVLRGRTAIEVTTDVGWAYKQPHSAVTGRLRKLEVGGYVTKRGDRYFITGKGNAALDELIAMSR